jgi:hypothetical protein
MENKEINKSFWENTKRFLAPVKEKPFVYLK